MPNKKDLPPDGQAEEPYATLTLKFYKKKGFKVEGEHIELLAPGHIHKIMPGVYREMRRLKGKLSFDTDRFERDKRKKALQLNELEDLPVKERIREIV